MSKIILPSDLNRPNADARHVAPMEHISEASSQGGASLGSKRTGSTRNYEGVRKLLESVRRAADDGKVHAPAVLPDQEWERRLKSPGSVCPLGQCSGSGWIEFQHPAEPGKTCVRRCACSQASQARSQPANQSETFRLLVLASGDE